MRRSFVVAPLVVALAAVCSASSRDSPKDVKCNDTKNNSSEPSASDGLTAAGRRIFNHRAFERQTKAKHSRVSAVKENDNSHVAQVSLSKEGNRIFNHRAYKKEAKAAPNRQESVKSLEPPPICAPPRVLANYEFFCATHGIVVKRHCHCIVCLHHCILPLELPCPLIRPSDTEGRTRMACDCGHSQLSSMPFFEAPLHGIAPKWLEHAGAIIGMNIGKIKCALNGNTFDQETDLLEEFEANNNPGCRNWHENGIRKRRLEIKQRALESCRMRNPSASECPHC